MGLRDPDVLPVRRQLALKRQVRRSSPFLAVRYAAVVGRRPAHGGMCTRLEASRYCILDWKDTGTIY